ncbi:MAG TPA: GNAT family N-acetyltransferase [Polyangia bacterium]|nr:GNAT family N-acetyltransferase [Polyangia bacterium]
MRQEDGREYMVVERLEDLPEWLPDDALVSFFHHTMKPWNDTLEDVRRALDYAFGRIEGRSGFAILAHSGTRLEGGIAILHTGMGGYVPANLLLFVAVLPELRGQGIGRRLIELAADRCEGDIKLHVEHDNPARRLYERVGFSSKYLEMRYPNR